VLRTDGARFQLFGDAMNVAARMEHTGEKGRIQVSQETARCLEHAGKGQWVRPRAETINVKGKGIMQTYWLDIQAAGSRATSESASSEHSMGRSDNHPQHGSKSNTLGDTVNQQQLRLVDWNVDILSNVLKEIVARREACNEEREPEYIMRKLEQRKLQAPLDEMAECISLPKYDAKKATFLEQNPESIDLGHAVRDQLHDYVETIASMYRENPFHSFEVSDDSPVVIVANDERTTNV
jgi:Adenylate and Guanylate cyclase catalytic domain